MELNDVIKKSKDLVEKSEIALLGSINQTGFPNIKAMLNLRGEGLEKIWFSTNTSSNRVKQLLENDKACVYYHTNDDYMGLMLTGKIKVMNDEESKKLLWFEGFEKYYPEGVNDPDYTVLCFIAEKADYYHKLEKMSFDI